MCILMREMDSVLRQEFRNIPWIFNYKIKMHGDSSWFRLTAEQSLSGFRDSTWRAHLIISRVCYHISLFRTWRTAKCLMYHNYSQTLHDFLLKLLCSLAILCRRNQWNVRARKLFCYQSKRRNVFIIYFLFKKCNILGKLNINYN